MGCGTVELRRPLVDRDILYNVNAKAVSAAWLSRGASTHAQQEAEIDSKTIGSFQHEKEEVREVTMGGRPVMNPLLS